MRKGGTKKKRRKVEDYPFLLVTNTCRVYGGTPSASWSKAQVKNPTKRTREQSKETHGWSLELGDDGSRRVRRVST